MRLGLIASILATVLAGQSAVGQQQPGPRLPSGPRVPAGPPRIEAGPPRVPAIRTPGLLVPAQSHDDDATCPGNLILNGGFDVLNGSPALTNTGVAIETAPGWTSAWQGPSTSRIYSHSAGVTAENQALPPLPGPGNHLAMYVTVDGTPMGPPNDYRLSAALGQLRVPIPAGSGTFSLSLRTSRLIPGGLLAVAIYGVRVPAGSPVPSAPTTTEWHSLPAAYGPQNVRWLGFVHIAPSQRAWETHTINFNAQTLATSSSGAPLGSITHILIHGGLHSDAGNAIGMDSFCLRSIVAS